MREEDEGGRSARSKSSAGFTGQISNSFPRTNMGVPKLRLPKLQSSVWISAKLCQSSDAPSHAMLRAAWLVQLGWAMAASSSRLLPGASKQHTPNK